MEVREPSAKYLRSAGYVQTELGVLPTDWRIAEIGQIAETSSGTTPPRSLYDRYFKGGVHAWVKTLDLNNAHIRETDESVTDNAIEETSLRLFPEGSVLVAMYGGLRQIGRTGLLRLPAAVNQAITAIRPNPTVFCPEFLLFYLNHRVGYWQSVASSSRKDPNITGADVRAFKLPLPEKGEQQRVAAALSDADALIDSLEQLLTKKRQIKQGAMQELLTGKRRLPGFDGEWVTCELRQLGHVVRGVAYNPGTDLADSDTEQTVRLLRSNNVQSGEIVRSGLQFVDRRRVRNDQYLQDGDLLLCMANGSRDLVGKTGRFERADEYAYTFGAFMACYRPDSTSVAPEFVAFLFQTHAFRQHVDLLLAGSSINNLRPEGVLGFTISIPSEHSEQVAIAQALADMDVEIGTLESRLTKARALKQAMAQALLTGRIRLVAGSAA